MQCYRGIKSEYRKNLYQNVQTFNSCCTKKKYTTNSTDENNKEEKHPNETGLHSIL